MLKVKSSDLAALLLCAGKNDVRYYLNGVYFTANAAGRPLAVATDGKRLLAVELEAPALPFAPRIIGREVLEKAAKPKGEVSIGPEEITISAGERLPYTPIDGVFPQYSLVLPPKMEPSKTPGVPAFDARYVADFAKVAQLLTGKKAAPLVIESRGPSSAALVRFSIGRAVGVVMPTIVNSMPEYRRSLFEEGSYKGTETG